MNLPETQKNEIVEILGLDDMENFLILISHKFNEMEKRIKKLEDKKDSHFVIGTLPAIPEMEP